MNHDVLESLKTAPIQCNVHPVLSVDALAGFAEILHEEGYPLFEVLGRPMDDAEPLIRAFSETPQRKLLYLAVGTLKTQADAERAVALDADLLVSATFSRRILDVAVEADVPYMPGISTLQDIQNVHDAFEDVGRTVKVLKLCPVDFIGMPLVEIMATIYPDVMFGPTGTVELEDLPTWRQLPFISAPMQSYIPEEMIAAGDWDGVRELLRKARQLAGM